jgi:hypothetical protein
MNEELEVTTADVTAEAEATATVETAKRGRPVVGTSARQARLAAREARKAAGQSVGRGRPVSGESARQKKLAEKAAKLAAGEPVKRGAPKKVKPVDPEAEAEAPMPVE